MTEPESTEAPRSREGQLAEAPLVATLGIVFGVLGATALAFAGILYALDQNTAFIGAINVVFAVAAITFFLLTHRARLRDSLSGRRAALGLTEGLLLVAVVGGLAAANYFAARSDRSWDLTENTKFTLQEQSIGVATRLTKVVKIIGFYRSQEAARNRLERLVDLYAKHTDKLRFENVNPDKASPAVLKKYNMSAQSPRIVVVTEDDRHTKAKDVTEEELTNAIIRVAEKPEKKLYFLAGHGEPDRQEDGNEEGYSRAARDLVDDGFAVEDLTLHDKDSVPRDAAALIVAAPKSALFPNEVDAILAYLKRGGRAFVLLDPGLDPKLERLFEQWGVAVGDDLVVDPNPASTAMGFGPDAPIITQFEEHPITAPLRGNALLFYWTRSVAPRLGIANLTVTTLLLTGPSSWGETKWRAGGDVEQDEGDTAGPVPIAVAVTKSTVAMPEKLSDEARLVVMGDASFASNRFGSMVRANSDLFLNVASWLAGEEQKISIRPKSRGGDHLALSQTQQAAITFFSVNFLPLLIVGVGLSIWAIRQRK